MTKEISEENEYMQNLEHLLMAKFDVQKAQAAYKILIRAVRPVYSGSLDHRINMLDAKKVLPILSLENFNQNKLSEQDLNLMIELKTMTEGLLQRSIFHGYWDCITDDKGSIPDSREGSAMAMVDNTIYLFGGFSREIYNDTRYYEIDNNVWGTVNPGPDSKIPEKRSTTLKVPLKLRVNETAWVLNKHQINRGILSGDNRA